MKLMIRESTGEDLEAILEVLRSAFHSEEEANLVRELLDDPTAAPRLSMLAILENQPVGHILFSKALFDPALAVQGRILGPLAVVSTRQKEGIGGKLIRQGLEILKSKGVDWVFVLGHPSYYPRFGFTPALDQGFSPPYPIPDKFTNAWMAQALTPTCITTYRGRIIPAKTFEEPKYWRE